MPAFPFPLIRSALFPRAVLALSAVALLVLALPGPRALAETAEDEGVSGGEPVSLTEHYAELLAEEPEGAAVVVDDATGTGIPHDQLVEELHAEFATLGVPYHVIVTPFLGIGSRGGSDEILPAVRDRLGADGLYVALPPSGMFDELQVYGHDELSAQGGRDAVHGAGMHISPVEEVVPVLVAGLADPGAQAPTDGGTQGTESLRDSFDPASYDGPENLGLLVGTTGGALLALGGWLTWRLRVRGRPVLAWTAVLVPVAVAALAVSLTYTYTVNAPVGEDEIPDPEEVARTEAPYVLSTERVERFAAALEEDSPLYVDPLTPSDRSDLERVPEAFEEVDAPVHAVVAPTDREDEAEGDPEVLAAALASVADREGVYLVVTQGADTTELGVSVNGLDIPWYILGSVMLGPDTSPNPARALEEAAGELAEMDLTQEQEGEEYRPSFADREPSVPGPRAERYWTEGFVPGVLFVGPFLAAVAIGLTYLLLHLRRREPGQGMSVMGRRSLERIAGQEAARLRTLLEKEPGLVPDEYMPQAEVALLYARDGGDELDLLGSAVLARRVLAVAQDPEAETTPCAVHPLHPFATERVRFATERVHPWSTGGRVPLCADCARAEDRDRIVRQLQSDTASGNRSYRAEDRERAVRQLQLHTASGERPYCADADNPWIRYSFGAHDPERMTGLLLEESRVR